MNRGFLAALIGISLAGTCATLLLFAGAVFSTDKNIQKEQQKTGQGTAQRVTEERNGESRRIQFPVWIEGTTLMAQSLAMYEGDMLEYDSDDHLVDAAALEIKNFGGKEVELAEVILEFGKIQMRFFGTNIPPGSTILMIEQEGKPWTQDTITQYSGWAQYSENLSLPDNAIAINDVDMGTVEVTNQTEEAMSDLWLFYKNYLYDAELYLGGITYFAQIEYLEPGETVQIKPDHYARGYSKIVKVIELG